ncbi:hypothetical protein ACJIZ3_002897 [Penstemon smallii]|uniref:Uncharacterized protein n=1 Tax=Penstemon smallii TaxID=265156 RepID=A0ABD3U7Q1_9LAMI
MPTFRPGCHAKIRVGISHARPISSKKWWGGDFTESEAFFYCVFSFYYLPTFELVFTGEPGLEIFLVKGIVPTSNTKRAFK